MQHRTRAWVWTGVVVEMLEPPSMHCQQGMSVHLRSSSLLYTHKSHIHMIGGYMKGMYIIIVDRVCSIYMYAAWLDKYGTSSRYVATHISDSADWWSGFFALICNQSQGLGYLSVARWSVLRTSAFCSEDVASFTYQVILAKVVLVSTSRSSTVITSIVPS